MDNLLKISKKWYVVVTNSIHYKKIPAILEKLGCPFYLPVQRQLHYWSDRKRWVNVPVLSPYLFLFTNESERKIIFESTHFFHFLKIGGKLATTTEEEIEKVKLFCNYSTNIKIEPCLFKKGDLVEVTNGPLSGMKGYTLQENGKNRFLVHITSLGQFASVEIDSSLLSAC
jgi:transcriptional antiterminator RfaH